MTGNRHCEERSDEAIQRLLHRTLDCFAGARNDDRENSNLKSYSAASTRFFFDAGPRLASTGFKNAPV